VKLLNIAVCLVLFECAFIKAYSQTPETRATLADVSAAADAKGVPAIEARLLTTVLNGAPDSPVINSRLVVKNVSPNFYTYVTGWATFYDAAGVRCGEGQFKVDALAPGESSETDTPGLRIRCTPTAWRVVATNLLTPTKELAAPIETAPTPVAPALVESKPAPVNFVISIDGEEHPIQVNHPLVLKLGNRNRKIVLHSVP
jgi:hypothetical protein